PITVRLIQQKICLSDDFIEEAIIVSDLFELNEMAAVELLLTAEGQQPSYPDLTRGLVAVLLYYDQQRCIWTASRPARRSPRPSSDVTPWAADGLLGAILDLLPRNERLAAAKLEEQRALGNARHRRQFGALQSQTPLGVEDLLAVMRFLQRDLPPAPAAIDRCHASLILAVLTSFDCSGPDGEEPDESHPLLAPADSSGGPGFAGRNPPSGADASAADADDDDGELSAEVGIADGAFAALGSLLAPAGEASGGAGAGAWCRGNEWALRCLHNLLTDYVCLMPMQVKCLRDGTDKAARIVASYAAQGLQPPAGLRRDFEDLLSILASLYPAGGDCELTLDYWLGGEAVSNDLFNLSKSRPSNRQVALAKFLRLASDVVLAPSLYIPFLRLLARLSCGRTQARACYAMLRAG
uniref:Nuclear pore complex protein n=1 Tax=Macrostomum lignano TaxID=282301 RepID=A0A1I8FK46_9PLAT